ncbi:MAG: hypothetical protein FJ382_10455 [Verrucomicrobia bacterium]|nr:hypothetical protein [Verrucomicrobiota bacterium]
MITDSGLTLERQFPERSDSLPNSTPTRPQGPRQTGKPASAAGWSEGPAPEVMTHDFLLANLHPELSRDALAAEERRLRAIDL